MAVILALTACSVGPNYLRPAAPVPAAYQESVGWKIARPGGGSLRQAWWLLFNDPQLAALEDQVLISNQNVILAEAQLRQAKALVQAARAGYYPGVTAGASVTRSGKGEAPASTDYSLPVDLSWEADLWGKIRRGVAASADSAQASEADLAGARLSAQAELAQDYFLLRIQDAQKELFAATVASYQMALDLTRNRYASGMVSKADLLLAQTQLKTAKAQAIDLDVQRSQLEHAVALLIGKPASGFTLPAAHLAAVFPQIPAGLPSQLLERRPDIASAERRMAAANEQIGIAKAAFFPTVRFSASAGLEALSLASWFTWPSRFWAVGPAVSESLLDGGLRQAQSEQARAAYDATVASYRQTVLSAFREVEDNLAALRILEAEAQAQDDALQSSRESLAVTLNQYRAGTIGYLNVTVAQSTALANDRTAVGILGLRLTAGVLLIKALGGGWDTTQLGDAAGVHLGKAAGAQKAQPGAVGAGDPSQGH